MIISIASLFPDLYSSFLNTSLVKRACDKGYINIDVENLFNFCESKKRIDSPTFGFGSGMLIKPSVVQKAIESQQEKYGPAYKIFFSPQGKKLDQNLLNKIYDKVKETNHIMFLPARYEGMDSRVEEHYSDCTISIGDFVLMGGDLPVMVFMESFLRLIPGVVGKSESVLEDSFQGPFVDYPEYTEPVNWNGIEVPEIVRSGNHKALEKWRKNQAAQKTVQCHFEWLRKHVYRQEDIELAASHIPNHYAVLMHDHVNLGNDRIGPSSVTSLDIHDIARSAATYGIKKYYIVTPLKDQQKIIIKLLSFWQSDVGAKYNPSRYKALSKVVLKSSLEEVADDIISLDNNKPIVIGTAAKDFEHDNIISYYDQNIIWSLGRPVLFIFGTAKGLSADLIDSCDYLLKPVKGFSSFNHLSVRSAAAIIFDRWLGISSVN